MVFLEYRVAKREEGFQESQLADFISHPKWDETEIYMDVALLKMAKPFKYTEYVKVSLLHLCIPFNTLLSLHVSLIQTLKFKVQ